ncbi:MAG: putative circadian clock protein KaiC [Steroidobacteraceae bacterium]|jgi:circadian clock protein KaiC|nr:putative circadian clock protein KaiC [Steroidobacteraceae bacterium]
MLATDFMITNHRSEIAKAPTGIPGLDEITHGGLPAGRPTLLAGGPGSGKTLLGVSFLVEGAQRFNEPGVLLTFEEKVDELATDVRSLGYDLHKLCEEKKLLIDYVHVDRAEIEETGEYDLEGLFVRLEHAIKEIGAKRVMLDTIETLFGGLKDTGILRAELRRLFRWLRDRGMTAIITAERGENQFTRQGLEEYVTDAVISLDHRVEDQISTRRIRIVKYRGSTHGTNEYPFLIGRDGINVLPVTSLLLEHDAPAERISTGLPALDGMLGGKGFYRASTVLLTGTAGTGKTTLSAHFVDAACARGEKCLYFLFEESPQQMMRNMASAGIHLKRWVDKGLLTFHAERPNKHGLENHLLEMHHAVETVDPDVVVVDPITNLMTVGSNADVRSMLTRLIDFLKTRGVTAMFASLTSSTQVAETTEALISSLMDSWVLVAADTEGNRRSRKLYVLKSRGMQHSDEVRHFMFTSHGIELLPSEDKTEGAVTVAGRTGKAGRSPARARKGK